MAINEHEGLLDGLISTPVRYLRRAVATTRNAAEVARFGGLDTGEQPSPFTVAAAQSTYRLRHYFPDATPTGATPVLLVPPLMMTAEVWDVSPSTSAVASLHAEGIDPWVVDFGDPGNEPGGLQRTLTDHVLAVSDAVDRVHAATGRSVILGGYSQGGMFAYQVTALRRGRDIDSLVTFGSPVDTTAPLPIPLPPDMVAQLANSLVHSGLLRRVSLPSWATRLGFNLLSPVKTVQGRIQFLLELHDREALLPRERQRRYLDSEGWTAYSGPAIAELLEQFVAHNRMVEGGFVIDDRLVTLADINVPVLTTVGTTDTIGHPDSVRAIRRAAPLADVYELTLRSGHFGLVVGSKASENTWPAVIAWTRWRNGTAELPDNIVPADQVPSRPLLRDAPPDAAAAALGYATDLGIGATRIGLGTARWATRLVRGVLTDAPALLPRLARIEHLDPSTRISLGLLLDEQARKIPNDISFLFNDRGYRQRDLKYRVDSVVKGLISVGVRQGQSVGVLMGTRPSAISVVAALSRIGATSVLLRPDGDLRTEATLGGVTHMISDPEHATRRPTLPDLPWCVLGGGDGLVEGQRRELPGDVLDMERIDPNEVELPAWYRPNPHRAADIAFVLFTGEGETTRPMRISNRRWAMSALGTASAAALRTGDTIYCVTPLHHSSALLMAVGGAIAGGARFAMASARDPETFWSEVRRYGATHISYTWTSLRDIALAPANPAEQHHPIRMFMGSGMPRNLWRRVTERFPTARVLEFYASAEGEAILANLTGMPIGSMGHALPGTPEVRVAAFDVETRSLELGEDGFGRECDTGEAGLLLARVAHPESRSGVQLRGVFEPDDAWSSTGDLFRRDDSDNLWRVESVSALVRTAKATVAPAPVRIALGSIATVDLCVAYGVPEGDAQVLVAALTLRPGASLSSADLDRALDGLPVEQRPAYVRVVPSIPVTTWHRPLWRTLQQEGVPQPSESSPVWHLTSTGTYEP
ncbi:AMP-binding protein [Pseudonocardia spinosispora]|uniref:AMP-binding protein n=1 Tax=Pseudonocardia spinosispora TaxID=103441 RepID=UPI0004095F6F|nr:AMP-binding protein [Pseudonocardia spinosispora]